MHWFYILEIVVLLIALPFIVKGLDTVGDEPPFIFDEEETY